jgi:uncharacterized sulfatase
MDSLDREPSSRRPNVLVIHTDQQSWWTLSSYGASLIDTPYIDRIGEEGARLTHFVVTSAVCTPSRGTFLTGRYPHVHGAFTHNAPLNRDEVTFAEVLRRSGYETFYAGKWHLDGNSMPGWVHPDRTMGFDHAKYMFNRGHWKKIADTEVDNCQPTVFPYPVFGDETTYPTDWLTAKTIAFLEQDHDRPFCAMLSIPDPHTPFRPRPPYDGLFDPADMPIPDTYDERSPFAAFAKQQVKKPDKLRLRQYRAWYLGAVKLIDDCVGRLLDCLEQQGVLDRTIVIFTSDHGEYMGEHGLMGKNRIYETAHRVPFLIRWPEAIPGRQRIDRVVASVDFQQTILGLVGVEACGREQGRDASTLLRGDLVDDWADRAFLHHSSHRWAGVITRSHLYAAHDSGFGLMFDRQQDPDEVNNLFGQGGDIQRSLADAVYDHLVDCQAPALTWWQG